MGKIYSFYSGRDGMFTDLQKAIDYSLSTSKPFKHTHGFGWKNPTVHNEPVSVDDAIRIIKNSSFVDIDERNDCIHINTYSGMDMW